MGDCLLLIHLQNMMGTIFDAITAMETDDRFVAFIIPGNRADNTGCTAMSATDTLVFIQADSAAGPQREGSGGTDLGAGRVVTGAADNNSESAFHTSHGLDLNASLTQAGFILSSYTGKHAALTADTSFRIRNS
jgi:hypothetical protein